MLSVGVEKLSVSSCQLPGKNSRQEKLIFPNESQKKPKTKNQKLGTGNSITKKGAGLTPAPGR